jgi:signal recognition particle subunit SRP68
MATAPNAPSEPQILLFSTLSILQLVKDAQQQHGLRHGDYLRYRCATRAQTRLNDSCRQYCERKVRRVRKSLKYVNAHKATGKHAAKFKSVRVLAKAVTDVK